MKTAFGLDARINPNSYGLQFELVKTSAEIMLHRTVRAAWFYQAGNISQDQFENNDPDGYDDHALHFLCRSSTGEILGVSRVTLPTHPLWYVEKYAEVPHLTVPRERRGEIARQGIHPHVRKDISLSTAVQIGLMWKILRVSNEEGIDLLINGVHSKYYNRLARILGLFGLKPSPMPGLKPYDGPIPGYEGYTENNPDPIVVFAADTHEYLDAFARSFLK